MTDELLVTSEGAVATVTFNRPERLNAITSTMLVAFEQALDRLAADPAVRCVVLRGAGRSFCSGFDLGAGHVAATPDEADIWNDRRQIRSRVALYLKLWRFPVPTIAAIHGHCMGGAVQFATCTDLTVVATDATIGWPRLPLGGGYLSPPFSLVVGPKRAREMSYLVGSTISGATALEWGLANRAVPLDEVAGTTADLARRVALVPRSLLEIKKAALNRVLEQQGFVATLEAAAEWDAFAHADPSAATLRGWIGERGMKDAIATFDEEGLR